MYQARRISVQDHHSPPPPPSSLSELDTYSSVISTFRAQGVLTQQKLTILSELRSLLNIDQDRHRAETRRATNDEELTTIADK